MIRAATVWFVGMSLVAFLPARCAGQSSSWWKAPGDSLTVDLTSQNHDRKTTFADDGLTFETTLAFAMVGKSRVSLTALLPENGTFQAQVANSAAGVEVRNVRVEAGVGRADIVSKASELEFKKVSEAADRQADQLLEPGRKRGLEAAKKLPAAELKDYLRNARQKVPNQLPELQQAYAQQWAIKNAIDPFRDWLTAFAKRRPRWLIAREPESWATADGQTLFARAKELMTSDRVVTALEACGLEVDVSGSNDRTALESRLVGVELLLGGKAASDPAVARLLSTRDLATLRRNFNVKLTCRLRPTANPDDVNAQWFDAQRVACRAQGASSIRVEGRLDGTHGDRVDWWYLDRYRPGTTILDLPKLPGVRWDQFPNDDGLRLRVVALSDVPVVYTFEIRTAGKPSTGPSIMIYESPNSTKPKFPY